jgi:hypothetical protein
MSAVEAAAASVHAERVGVVLSLRRHRSSQKPLRQKEEGEKVEERLNAALHKTSPNQGERPASSVGFGLLCQRERTGGK